MRTLVILGSLLRLMENVAAEQITGTVSSAHDGDTLRVVKADGTEVKVRFVLCDAPEIGQPGGEQSRDFLRDLCLNKQVTVETSGTDAFGRTLGEVTVSGVNVNKKMIEAGHGWWFYNFDNPDDVEEELAKLEGSAKAAKRGLWDARAPIYPRAWRDGARPDGSSGGGDNENDGGSGGSDGGSSGTGATLFIMALLPDPIGEDANNETVILANSSDVEASIDQWKLQDAAGGVFTLSGTVPPGGSRTVRLNESLQLGNGGDSVELRKPSGSVQQKVTYPSAQRGRFIVAQ